MNVHVEFQTHALLPFWDIKILVFWNVEYKFVDGIYFKAKFV